ncbi:MAG: ankyrin repeat domain-containing protein, partial [Candidatus Gastranaerophilales bacterium]|nr:ankyrin repeat domain-containing protein [Candidatus Gastranaerophilales bacterium]
DVNAVSKNDGETALILAARYNAIEHVLELIDAKADLNIKDKNGKSALSYAVSWAYRGEPELQKILISAGADKSDYKMEFEPDETGELQLMLSKIHC